METPRAPPVNRMILSTPSPSSFVSFSRCSSRSHRSQSSSEFEILEEVSRLTLNSPPRSPPLSPFRTPPTVRKRKPSCVTPPLAIANAAEAATGVTGPRLLQQQEASANDKRWALSTNKMAAVAGTGLPPMLPTSPELDDGASSIALNGAGGGGVIGGGDTNKNNPFTRHRPLYSPFSGVSAINHEFFATFKLEEEVDEEDDGGASAGVVAATTATTKLHTFGRRTKLLDPINDTAALALGNAFPDLEDDVIIPVRALKMRRRMSNSEFDLSM